MGEPAVLGSQALRDSTILFLAVVVSRLPFLSTGFGLDPDAWRLANAARRIAETGQYVESRSPGHPVQEIACALLPTASPFAFNFITALGSAVAAVVFHRILLQSGVRKALLPSIAFAFVPVIFLNSTNSMDYLWALPFLLGGVLAALNRRPLVAGILIGFATGCRLTSLAALLPIGTLLALLRPRREFALKPFLQLILGAGITSVLLYAPFLLEYGFSRFRFAEAPYPGTVQFLRVVLLDVWGPLGSVAILLALLACLRFPAGRAASAFAPQTRIARPLLAASLLAIGIYFAAFLRLPHDAGYLIPAVPFTLLVCTIRLGSRGRLVLSGALLLSPFLFDLTMHPVDSTRGGVWKVADVPRPLYVEPLRGPMLADSERRRLDEQRVRATIRRAREIERSGVLVAGHRLPKLLWFEPDSTTGGLELVYSLSEAEARTRSAGGAVIYYLPGMVELHERLHGFDLNSVARPLPGTPPPVSHPTGGGPGVSQRHRANGRADVRSATASGGGSGR